MLHIIYRICFKSNNQLLPSRKRPFDFSSAACQDNLISTISKSTANLHVIADEYYGKINLSKFEQLAVNILHVKAGTEALSFLFALKYALSLNLRDNENIYFLEDDYTHKPNWIPYIQDGLNIPSDYVSLYDHPDKYRAKKIESVSLIKGDLTYWRLATSTCNTFGCTFGTLKQDFDIHYFFSRYPNLSSKSTRDQQKFESLIRYRNRKLVTPIPSISIHQTLPLPNFVDQY
jgi:hypothetical protein